MKPLLASLALLVLHAPAALASPSAGVRVSVSAALRLPGPPARVVPRACAPVHPATFPAASHHRDDRYEVRRVWVPARVEWVHVPERRGVVLDACGRPREVVLDPGGWRAVHHPGRWEVRRTPRVARRRGC